LRAQKKEQEKGTRLSRPPAADNFSSCCCRDVKKTRSLAANSDKFLRYFPPTAAMLSVKEWDLIKNRFHFIYQTGGGLEKNYLPLF